VADRLAHPSDLPVATLTDREHQRRLAPSTGDVVEHGVGGQRPMAVEWDAVSQAAQGRLVRHPRHTRAVAPLDAVSRMGERGREVAVVGEEQ
jgi:hypothetical protein